MRIKRKLLMFIFLYEPLAEFIWLLLKWSDNRRKGKTVSEFWNYIWIMMIYGEVNGRVPLGDIEEGWRKGTWFEFKGDDPGFLGPVYLDTPYGTIYKGKKVVS